MFPEVLSVAKSILQKTFGFTIIGIPLEKPTAYILRNELQDIARESVPWSNEETGRMVCEKHLHCISLNGTFQGLLLAVLSAIYIQQPDNPASPEDEGIRPVAVVVDALSCPHLVVVVVRPTLRQSWPSSVLRGV